MSQEKINVFTLVNLDGAFIFFLVSQKTLAFFPTNQEETIACISVSKEGLPVSTPVKLDEDFMHTLVTRTKILRLPLQSRRMLLCLP